jgi:SpoVK/Ycf46/Vps4 family AAA+-type ATPase
MTLIADLIARLTTLTTGWRRSTAFGELVGCHPAVDQAIDHTLEQASKIASAFKRHEPSGADKNWEAQPFATVLPKGLVIYGQGCGCGGLARAIAKEINAHFIAGTTCESSGRASSKESVAHYFNQAKELAQVAAGGRPVLLYLSGANFLTSAAADQEQALEAQAAVAEIARQTEQLSTNSNVLVLIEAHTLSQLDAALLADGRFDVQIEVEKPDYKGRLSIFQHHLESYHDLPKPTSRSQQKQSVQILVSLDGAWEGERQAELDQICKNCAVLTNGLYADQIYRAMFQLRAQAAISGSITAEQLYRAIETQQGKP